MLIDDMYRMQARGRLHQPRNKNQAVALWLQYLHFFVELISKPVTSEFLAVVRAERGFTFLLVSVELATYDTQG